MDILSDILRALRLRAEVFFNSTMCGNWDVGSSGEQVATFHLVARGACWLRLAGEDEAIPLNGGDLLVFPRDAPHTISGCRASDPDQGEIDGAGDTTLVCGYFRFGRSRGNPLIDSLPEVIHLRGSQTVGWLDTLVRLIAAETERDEPGSQVLVDRLADALFIHVVRACIDQETVRTGLLAALADERLSNALGAFHAAPEDPWSLTALAEAAHMSRTAFAARFQRVTGTTPMQYVTQWRMHRAWDALETGGPSIAEVAERSGYQSEAAFNKAFKKIMGVTPGAVRRGAGRAAPVPSSTALHPAPPSP